jgi:hypothetical protein
MKPFMFAHADAAADPARELSEAELALVTGGSDMQMLGPDIDTTQKFTKISDGSMHRDGYDDDVRG